MAGLLSFLFLLPGTQLQSWKWKPRNNKCEERLSAKTKELGFLMAQAHTGAYQSWPVHFYIYYYKRKIKIPLGSAATSWPSCYLQPNTFLTIFKISCSIHLLQEEDGLASPGYRHLDTNKASGSREAVRLLALLASKGWNASSSKLDRHRMWLCIRILR